MSLKKIDLPWFLIIKEPYTKNEDGKYYLNIGADTESYSDKIVCTVSASTKEECKEIANAIIELHNKHLI